MQALPTFTLAPAPSRRLLLALALPTVLSIASAALIVVSPPAAAQTGASEGASLLADPEVATALARFDQAGPDNHAAIEDAAERLSKLSTAQPANPVLRAYAGAAVSMRALTTMLPWRKMSLTEDGLAQVDKALAQLGPAHEAPLYRGVPAVLETRFIAAATFLNLPAMFNRSERGRKQLDEVLKHPLFDGTPAPFKAVVWLRAARLAEADQQPALRKQWLEKVAASDAPQAAAARDRLKAL
jgi:hypothetical protein